MKDEILAILKQNPGDFVSGQQISEQLGVTRAAVWKYMKQLRAEGYAVESVSRKGYRLTACADVLTEAEVKDRLKTHLLGRKIRHFDSLPSTNTEARRLAEQGEPEGTVVVAETQTGGRGCVGRPWESPASLGIWMSVILRPKLDLAAVPRMTMMACAAAGQALEPLTGGISFHWPNDLFCGGKKIGGVLTETSGEIAQVQDVVLGIGINVNHGETDFSPELAKKATSVRIASGRRVSRQALFCEILERLEALYLGGKDGAEQARRFALSRSEILGKTVSFSIGGKSGRGAAEDLDINGRLVVRLADGSVCAVSSASQAAVSV